MRRISKQYYVYILTNQFNFVLYVGMTSDINKRIFEHKAKFVRGFTKKYNLNKLVYLAIFEDAYQGVTYERKLKGWSRKKKLNLITTHNPSWNDLLFRDPSVAPLPLDDKD